PPPRTYTLSLHDALPISPAAPGLFARAIIESGVIGAIYGSERTAAWAGRFVELLGGTTETAVELLTTAAPEALVAATSRLDQQADRKSTRLNSSHDQISY